MEFLRDVQSHTGYDSTMGRSIFPYFANSIKAKTWQGLANTTHCLVWEYLDSDDE